jgi:hypothetical protein
MKIMTAKRLKIKETNWDLSLSLNLNLIFYQIMSWGNYAGAKLRKILSS